MQNIDIQNGMCDLSLSMIANKVLIIPFKHFYVVTITNKQKYDSNQYVFLSSYTKRKLDIHMQHMKSNSLQPKPFNFDVIKSRFKLFSSLKLA